MAKTAKPPPMPKAAGKGPAVMIMIGLKPAKDDPSDMMGRGKPPSFGASKPKSPPPPKKPAAMSSSSRPSNSGKVPAFGGKTRRTWTGS